MDAQRCLLILSKNNNHVSHFYQEQELIQKLNYSVEFAPFHTFINISLPLWCPNTSCLLGLYFFNFQWYFCIQQRLKYEPITSCMLYKPFITTPWQNKLVRMSTNFLPAHLPRDENRVALLYQLEGVV